MKLPIILLLAFPLLAQDTPTKPDEQKTEQKADQKAASPSPATEPAVSGTVDFGYRWVSGVGGDFKTYRSVVNLGEGPKLLGVDLLLRDPSKRCFDKATLRMNSWGGDPYNTARFDIEKQRLYSFALDYRNIAYYNFLPSYADPSTASGVYFSERSFDLQRRFLNTELDLFPGRRIVPYLSFMRDWNSGGGITNFSTESTNNYAVRNNLRDKTDNFRGGVRIEMNRFHLTLEQGGTTFKDDQRVFYDVPNPGDRTTPLFGQQLTLTNLQQAYGVRGDSVYSKVLFSASPASWINFYGQFLYSRPESKVNYLQSNVGNFVSLNPLFFYSAESDLASASATQPHTSGTAGFEIRPFKRVRIVETWMTDRFHNASSAFLTGQLLLAAALTNSSTNVDNARLVYNYNRQRAEVFFDLTGKLTLHGGHEYVWGESKVPAPDLSVLFGGLESGDLRRHVGIGGLNYRASQKLSANIDFEGSGGDRTYFRTSLQHYEKGRVRARYQAINSLALTAQFSVLNNENPAPTVNYDFLSRDNSISALWTPWGGKRFSLLADYTRSTLRSHINYSLPEQLQVSQLSFYKENANTGTALLDVALPAINKLAGKLSVGGSFFESAGTRPTRYYQPIARLMVPLSKHVQWTGEWRWYGLTETFYLYEGFRSHQFMTGLRLIR